MEVLNNKEWTKVVSKLDAGRGTETLYEYLKVNGGWLVRCYDNGLTFIVDQNHENEPLPVE